MEPEWITIPLPVGLHVLNRNRGMCWPFFQPLLGPQYPLEMPEPGFLFRNVECKHKTY